MKKILLSMLFVAVAVLSGCSGGSAKLITFNIATMRGVDTGLAYRSVVMPFTGTRLIMSTDVFLYSGDISDIHVAENTMPDGRKIEGFYFILNDKGIRKLTTATASNMGSYIVMSYGGSPIGLRIIDAVITDGRLFICSEFFDNEKTMHKLVDEMREELGKVNEIKEEI